MARIHKLTISHVERETPDAVSIGFSVPDDLKSAFDFTPGQYLTLVSEIDGTEVRRPYSICSPRGDKDVYVGIKKVPDGRFSSHANDVLKVGDTLDVMVPQGRFKVNPNAEHAHHYVAFAAGSGITPILSIITSVLNAEPDTHVTLFYGNRTLSGTMFRSALETLKDRFHARFSLIYLFSAEEQDSPMLNGRIDRTKAGQLVSQLINPERVDAFLICGPGTMIEDVQAALKNLNVPEDKILHEMFQPAGQAAVGRTTRTEDTQNTKPADLEGPASVTVIMDGIRTRFDLAQDGAAIVDAARDAGVDAPFSCKGGVCATCRAKVIEGEVAMISNYALRDDEVEEGFILTCQSHPRSQSLVVDYDAV